MAKPRVLLLGGMGFIGRNMVRYLVENDLASKIRIADKVFPAMANLGVFEKFVENDKVEFVQANLSSDAGVTKAFEDEEGDYQYVFNLAGETKYGQSPEVYKDKMLGVTIKVAKEAAKRGVERFVELSSGQVYKAKKGPCGENGDIKPWTELAVSKLAAEEELKKIDGLKFTILRASTVYGMGDLYGITPRLVVAATYQFTKSKMVLLWDKDLRVNTVHVTDCCRAMFHVAGLKDMEGKLFNLSDKGDTTQGKLNDIIAKVFGIETGFHGGMKSRLAKTFAKDMANEDHMAPWSEMLKGASIVNTPLSPYLDDELLSDAHHWVDGSAIEKAADFVYEKPEITPALVEEVINYYQEMNLWPKA